MKKPILYKSKDIYNAKECGKITGDVLKMVKNSISDCETTLDIDYKVKEFLKSKNAIPATLGYKNYPHNVCVSIDDVVLHGLPNDIKISDGMLLGIDCPVYYKGMYTDSAINIEIGEVDKNKKRINKISYECLMSTINIIKPNITIGDICLHQQSFAKENGYDVIKSFRGHGVGKKLHEPPYIPYFYYEKNPYNDYKLQEGNIIAVEPTLVTNDELILMDDGWGYKTSDGSIGCNWEHTILITKNGCEILTKME
tara:strand:+ start:2039 stop:2800 length:762 start_codon:yes stop_codon:yes gene_type:complete